MSTIAAISTATGNGGIGIIRMSGKKCFDILNKIFIPYNNTEISGYTMKFGYIINPKTKQKVDEVLVSFFIAPKSYTTENMCEINSHGGIMLKKKNITVMFRKWRRTCSTRGIYEKSIFNGRIDLTQAESVIDLINSKTENEAKASIKQLEGVLSKQIKQIKRSCLM